MSDSMPLSRRRLLKQLALTLSFAPFAARIARAAAELLAPGSAPAKAVQYTEDAASSKAPAGNRCANCALYQGTSTSAQGACQIFPGKEVKAAGWCSSWAPQM
jgi:hypothetical protein